MKREFYSQIQTEGKKILPIVSVYRKYSMLCGYERLIRNALRISV